MAELKLGCDLCEIAQMEPLLQERAALERLFQPEERAYALARQQPAQHLAGIFAAKEALAKAVKVASLLGPLYADVAVEHADDGAPRLRLSDRLRSQLAEQHLRVLDCSISHDGAYAMAAVLVEFGDRPEEPRPSNGPAAPECVRCRLTLAHLHARRVTDVLFSAVDTHGRTVHVCPPCARGW
jgi:phosphopantetheine--protein transferase-like protein